MRSGRGIEERRGSHGRPTYRVRMRRAGQAVSASFPTWDEADAFRAAWVSALNKGVALPASPRPSSVVEHGTLAVPTIEDTARALCSGILAGSVRTRAGTPFKPSVARKYESMLRLFVLPRVGALPVGAIARRDVQRLVDELAAEQSAETACKALTALRVTLRVAERNGLVEANPCAGVRVPTNADGERPARILTPEEAEAIVAAAEAHDAKLRRSLGGPLFALAFGTGLRSGELLALPWGPEGLDLDAGIVHVRRALDRDRDSEGNFAFVAPKSRASRRDVPLPPADVVRLLRQRLASGRPADGSLVFADERGRPLDAKGIVRYAWRVAVNAAGIASPLPVLHDARHAFATHLLAAGITPHGVARLLGHNDVALIYRRYGHALPEELAGAGLALERFRQSRAS